MGDGVVLTNLSLEETLALIGIIVGASTFIWQNFRTIQIQRIELYHRLETGSIEVFRFEAQNADSIERLQDVTLQEHKFGPEFDPLRRRFGSITAMAEKFNDIQAGDIELNAEERAAYAIYEQERLLARKLYEQTANLFEMATRFRNKRIIEPEVFGSWVIWFYDTLVQWSFRDHWPDLKQNYTPDLRSVFNEFVLCFDPEEDIDARKRRFFGHVARVTKCPIIRDWIKKLDEEDAQLAKLRAARR